MKTKAVLAAKNHDFACLGCGRDPLDKGEKFCPGCGTENPGFTPLADHKIPANKTAPKERVTDQPVTKSKGAPKGKKGKKKKKAGKGNLPPFLRDKDQDAGKDGARPKAEKRKKGGRKGYGRSPAEGIASHETQGLPPHREPDGPAMEAFEQDAGIHDGDGMDAAARKSARPPLHLAALHDLTCAAYSPQAVTEALPHATFAGIDAKYWQEAALKAAGGGGTWDDVQAAYNEAAYLSRGAVVLKTADPQVLHDLRLEAHAAFLGANADLLKTFTDATPGPGSAPVPGHMTPGAFRRPYISAGHAAPSPQADGPRTFAVPEGHPDAQDYTRGYLPEGHASQSPANGAGHLPVTPPSPGGAPQRVYYANTMRDNARQAMTAMHDHISRVFPDVCPMSPEPHDVQKPAPPVPAGVGAPEPHAAKSAKAKAKARRKGAGKKGKARLTKSAKAQTAKRAAPPVPDPAPALAAGLAAPGPDALKAALAEMAVTLGADLRKSVGKQFRARDRKIRAQDKALRKVARTADAIAGTRDTTGAPYRGASAAKSATTTLTSAPAGPRTAEQAAELAKSAYIQRLNQEYRDSWNPVDRENARRELTAQLGIDPMTGHDTSIRNPT